VEEVTAVKKGKSGSEPYPSRSDSPEKKEILHSPSIPLVVCLAQFTAY
jgi:hypothetical protein